MPTVKEIFFTVFFGVAQLLLLTFIFSNFQQKRKGRHPRLSQVDVPVRYFQRLIYCLFIMLPFTLILPFLVFFFQRSNEDRIIYIFVLLAVMLIYLLTYFVYAVDGAPSCEDKKGPYDH